MSTRRTAGSGRGSARRAASAMRCHGHHNLEEYLTAYLDGGGLRGDPKGPLFRTIGRSTRRICYSADALMRRPGAESLFHAIFDFGDGGASTFFIKIATPSTT